MRSEQQDPNQTSTLLAEIEERGLLDPSNSCIQLLALGRLQAMDSWHRMSSDRDKYCP